MKREYDSDSVEYALELAKGRSDILTWSKIGTKYKVTTYHKNIGTRTFTLNEAHAFLIGLVMGKGNHGP